MILGYGVTLGLLCNFLRDKSKYKTVKCESLGANCGCTTSKTKLPAIRKVLKPTL